MGRKPITPLDPDSPAGEAAAEALSEVLAEIQVAVWRRRAEARDGGRNDQGMSEDPIREATRGFIALVAAHLGGIDTDTFAQLAQDVATEGGPNRMTHLLAVGVGMARDLIHELAVATGRPEDEILQEYGARWAD